VEFRLGELEHLPVADGTVDVIMSNCVVNLVPDKAQLMREAFRVLKPGGRLAISDVLRVAEFPPEILASDRSLSACISGAASRAELEGHLREAGFTDVRVAVNQESGSFIKDWEPGSGAEDYVQAAIIEARK
jgi:SAM-dependent methyltransferase